MRRVPVAGQLVICGVVGFACQNIALIEDGTEVRDPLTCESNRDCGSARCERDLGLCVSDDVGYQEVLLEIVPQSTDERAGGLRLFHRLTAFTGAPAEAAVVEILSPPTLGGSISLWDPPGNDDCLPVPLDLTLIPRESLKGIPATRYTTVADRGFVPGENRAENFFDFDRVPVGTYDLYWKDAGRISNLQPECEVVPQLFRGQLIDKRLELSLVQPPPDPVTVEIPWPEAGQDDLHGWTVDVVHPVTGQRISTHRELRRELVEETETGDRVAIADLLVANIVGDYGTPGQELLRLQPPLGLNRPTIYFVLFPLVTIEGGPAQVPGPVETFASQRHVEVWVWEREGDDSERAGVSGYENPVPVAGSVKFTARQLADEPDSFFRVSFSRIVSIAENGKVELDLPPGSYTVQVRPEDQRLSTYDTTMTVWTRARGESASQAGRIIEVPRGAAVNGRVTFPGELRASDAQVQLLPAPRLGPSTLAEPGLLPRTLTTLTGSSGRFAFPHADCYRCDDERGFDYLLRVIPPNGTELPWLLKAPFRVAGRTTDESLRMTFPQLHYGRIVLSRFGGTLPFALIRAHVLLDADGRPLPADAISCLERTPSTPPQVACAQGAVAVAETRADADGRFRLLLPTWPAAR